MAPTDDKAQPGVPVAIHGAGGRMGQALAIALVESGRLRPCAAWVGAASSSLGRTLAPPAPALTLQELGAGAERPELVIDFSSAEGLAAVLAWCRSHRVALVSGSTGLSAELAAELRAAASEIPVLWSANFSLGVAVLKQAVELAARALPDWDVEIVEAHHSGKRDAPSGTALALADAVANGRGQAPGSHHAAPRHGVDRRREAGEIGFGVVRAGDIVGEHSVWLVTRGERLELAHRATDRALFARGAVHAASWLAGRPAGWYRFEDTLTG